jgi:hypothetical protein
MEEASLSSYRPVIVHAWFLATDRALGALVRLRGYAGQSKARIGMSSYFFSRCLFYEYWEDRVFSSCSLLGAGFLSRERKTIKAGRDLAVAWILLLLLLVVSRCRFGFMYLPCCEGTPVHHLASPPDIQACLSSHRLSAYSVLNLADLADLNWTRTINHTAATTNNQSYTTTDDR